MPAPHPPRAATTPDATGCNDLRELLACAASAVSSISEGNIFEVLVLGITEALGVDLAFVGVLIEGRQDVARTIAFCDRGQVVPNFEYELHGTPCEDVMGQELRFYAEGIQDLFSDPRIQAIGGVGYAAIPLFDSEGRSIGLMAIVDRKPLRDRALTKCVLEIFSVRAAIELERRTANEARRHSEENYRSIFEERVRLEGQLRQAQKMEAIGQLTGGIAHDFNNILTGTLGYVAMARERADGYGDATLAKYLDRAERSGERAKALIQEMLTFSRGQRGEPRSLQLGPRLTEAVKLLTSSLPSSLEICTDIGAEIPSVLIDPLHLEQVLMNLCINARDAMAGRGTLQVSLGTATCSRRVCSSCHQAVAGSFIELAVSDSGPGIAPEVLERMFEPFFSTKEVGQGSGMGLAMVHGIVHEYGGHILAQSEIGKGTILRVWLPASPPAAADDSALAEPSTQAEMAAEAPRVRGRILLADDEASVREFMEDLLGSWGLAVTLAEDGVQACDRLTESPEGFELVLLDQTMPRITGLEAAAEIAKLHPHIPVILYTGYSEHLADDQISAAGVRALVRKPLDIPAFRELLEELLPACDDRSKENFG